MDKDIIKNFKKKFDEIEIKGIDKVEAMILFINFTDDTGTGCFGGDSTKRIEMIMNAIGAMAKTFKMTDIEFCEHILSLMKVQKGTGISCIIDKWDRKMERE